MIVLFPPFQFGCLLFLFLVWLLWLGLPILCWIEVVKAGILVLFLILVGKLLVFLSIEYVVGCRSLVYDLHYVEECSLYSHFAECFNHKWVLYFIKSFFYIYWYDHVIFVFRFVYLLVCEYCTVLAVIREINNQINVSFIDYKIVFKKWFWWCQMSIWNVFLFIFVSTDY